MLNIFELKLYIKTITHSIIIEWVITLYYLLNKLEKLI